MAAPVRSIGKCTIAEALLSQLSPAERLRIGRSLLVSINEPALFPALSVAARDIETAALRLARAGFEGECK